MQRDGKPALALPLLAVVRAAPDWPAATDNLSLTKGERLMKIGTLLLAALALLVGGGQGKADIIVSNLSNQAAGQDGPPTTNAAQVFTMGATSEQLADVKLLLRQVGGSLSDVAIFSNNGNKPGTKLLDLGSVTPNVSGDAVYTLTPATSFTLAANTTYWVEVSYSGQRVWDFTNSNSWTGSGTLGNGNGTFAQSFNGGSSWQAVTGAPYQLEVDSSAAGAVPEPSSLALFAMATATFAGCFGWRRRKRATA
jgi:hypothetical protein